MNKTKLNNQIEEYLEWCECVRGMSEQTMTSKYYVLHRFAKQVQISSMEELTNKDIFLWIKGMRDGTLTGKVHCANTCNLRIKYIRSFIKWLNETETCKVPAKLPYIQPVKPEPIDHQYYSRRNIEKVLKESDDRQRAMISLMFESGLRLTEFQNIRVGDIDYDKRRIKIIGKGNKSGFVYFTYETAFSLKFYSKMYELQDHDYLWRSKRNGGLPYTRDAVRSIMRQAFEKAGYNNFHPHALRHSFATDLMNNGATIQETQKLLRHENVSTTEIYIHNLDSNLGLVFDKIKKEGVHGVDRVKIIKT